ncbi:WYL domain-containing protein [uncultured Thiocystis sp.]|uniref:WYL domain-containing protein n=1 Tax=uncultured Thiocystis sp. TaxID=1202134 RepID=UPI0025E00AD7|nr:WYL domain-containing protein [uncultured Thiocystis sp.]
MYEQLHQRGFRGNLRSVQRDLVYHLQTGAFEYVADGSPTLALRLRMTEATAAHLHETPLAEDQTIANDATVSGWVQVSATVLDSAQLIWWLRGFGDQVEVLAPEPLRQRMLVGVRGLAALYGIS